MEQNSVDALKIGDTIKVVSNTNKHNFAIGTIGTIKSLNGIYYGIEDCIYGKIWYLVSDEFIQFNSHDQTNQTPIL